jgi:thiol-disulfide isomerase/thioredoxin
MGGQCRMSRSVSLAALAVLLFVGSGRGGAAPARTAGRDTARDAGPGCRLVGRITSSEYGKWGGTVERAIVYAYAASGGGAVANVDAKGEQFELRLPPGDYRLSYSAVGSRGATFEVKQAALSVKPGQRAITLDTVDLPVSKTTRLYGQTAPEIQNAAGWKNTSPGKLADLRGRVVVLDFFAHYCTICHVHAPELARIAQKYRNQGLAVLTVHDDSVASVAEMDENMAHVVKQYWGGKDLGLPTVLDGGGEKGIFRSYGIGAVPAMILIDPQGRVVRRFHTAADPEFEKEIQRLLSPRARRR